MEFTGNYQLINYLKTPEILYFNSEHKYGLGKVKKVTFPSFSIFVVHWSISTLTLID